MDTVADEVVNPASPLHKEVEEDAAAFVHHAGIRQQVLGNGKLTLLHHVSSF